MERTLLTTLDYTLTALTPLRTLEMLRLHASSRLGPSEGEEAMRIRWREVWSMAGFILELALSEFAEVTFLPLPLLLPPSAL